eukprot:649858-Amphidinium_carterae.1
MAVSRAHTWLPLRGPPGLDGGSAAAIAALNLDQQSELPDDGQRKFSSLHLNIQYASPPRSLVDMNRREVLVSSAIHPWVQSIDENNYDLYSIGESFSFSPFWLIRREKCARTMTCDMTTSCTGLHKLCGPIPNIPATRARDDVLTSKLLSFAGQSRIVLDSSCCCRGDDMDFDGLGKGGHDQGSLFRARAAFHHIVASVKVRVAASLRNVHVMRIHALSRISLPVFRRCDFCGPRHMDACNTVFIFCSPVCIVLLAHQ